MINCDAFRNRGCFFLKKTSYIHFEHWIKNFHVSSNHYFLQFWFLVNALSGNLMKDKVRWKRSGRKNYEVMKQICQKTSQRIYSWNYGNVTEINSKCRKKGINRKDMLVTKTGKQFWNRALFKMDKI